MQREKKDNSYPRVKKYYSILLWKECRFCGKEFKKENGYKIIDFKKCRRSDEYPLCTYYCCTKCSNSIEEVKVKVKKENDLNIMRINPPKC
ncbi:hypothetical protein ACTFJW_04325 [Clostridium cagae]|uniref:hypothetical protein n=1 Tax=Clostridium cagae TaxID=2080751 RepID=UPI003F76044D